MAVILLLGLLFGGLGLLVINRSARRSRERRAVERTYRESQAEFNETMQIMRDEVEPTTSSSATSSARSPGARSSCSAATTPRIG